jgi:hypothetical protein
LGDAATQLKQVANSAFVDGMHWGVFVAAVGTFLGMLVVLFFLPARASVAETTEQELEYAAEHRDEFPVDGIGDPGGVPGPEVSAPDVP